MNKILILCISIVKNLEDLNLPETLKYCVILVLVIIYVDHILNIYHYINSTYAKCLVKSHSYNYANNKCYFE